MMKNNNLFFWGICSILFLPIIILPPTFQPADWSRALLFRIIMAILISLLFFKFLYKKEGVIAIPQKKNLVYLPFFLLLGFLFILILATIFSQDMVFSIFGSPSRAGGTLNMLFFVIFVVLLALFTDENSWKKLFNLLFIAGVLISSLAVVQYFNIFKNIFISFGTGNAPSFLGNSTFLAIYMIFLSFLSFTLLMQEQDKKKKIIYGALFLLFIFTVLITGARATYLGILIGLIFFFFFYPKKIKTVKIIAASILLFTIIIAVLLNIFPQIGEKNNLLKIAVNRLSVKRVATDLLGTRFAAWKITIEGIKDKPILGWGPENFYIAFEKYYDPNITSVKNMWWDRPHNVFLDIAVSSGIFSAIIYCLFWLALLWQLQIFKRQRGDDKHTYLAHGLQSMFIAYLTALFFNFDNISTYFVAFFFIGYAFYLLSNQGEKITIAPPKTLFFQKKPAIISFLIIVILFIWFWNIRPLYLNEKIVYASNLADIKKCSDSLPLMENIWKKSYILNAHSSLKYADIIKKCATPKNEVEYSKKVVEALKLSAKIRPKNTRTWLFMGVFTNVLAAREENVDNRNNLLSEARSIFNNALKLSPKRQEAFTEIEKNYLIAKDYEAIKKTAYDCIAVDSNYGLCYWYLGVAEIFLGDQENGKKHIEEYFKKNPDRPLYVQLGVAYISQKNYADAAEAYRLAILFNDDKNASWHAVLAFLYKQIGEYKKAGQSAVQVFKLQPDNEEVIEFIKQLLGLDPNDLSLHSSLGYIYNQIGELEKAKKEFLIVKSFYERAVVSDPKNSNYHFGLASVCKELEEYEKAYQEALLTEKLNPDFHTNVSNLIDSMPQSYRERYLKEK